MKLTSKGRYAVTAILDIALHAGTDASLFSGYLRTSKYFTFLS